jgi:bifunctional non-homologous end joining protein LigD
MSLVNSAPSVATAIQKRQGNAVFMAFDVLAIHGQPTAALPLSERRVLLSAIIGHLHAVDPSFQIITQMPATTDNIALCLDEGFEGVMLKRKSGRYVPGKRMADWQKVKRYSTGDFFIIGSVPGNGRNDGKVGSMKVAYLDDAGHEVYCADVAGIDDAFRNELTDPETGRLSTSFVGKVIEVMAQGKTKNGRLRHPHFVRLRPDKSSEDCTSECSIALFEDV